MSHARKRVGIQCNEVGKIATTEMGQSGQIWMGLVAAVQAIAIPFQIRYTDMRQHGLAPI